MSTELLLAAFIAAVLGYAFLNGMNDSGGLVAAAISPRSLSPRFALALASVAEFLGPFLLGTVVAATIGKNLAQSNAITIQALLVATASTLVWTIAMIYIENIIRVSMR